ncbi:MAG: MFS transporter [Armatimonadota bacterium]|nr:MFS transporter [bacterium]
MKNQDEQQFHSALPERLIDKAIKISYSQAILSSIFLSIGGGMFVIGYALKLGANNAQIGLMTTLPMYCVVFQLLASMLTERGISRRKLVTIMATINAAGYLIIATIPSLFRHDGSQVKVGALIGLLTVMTLFLHITNNARSSWLADLIPPRRLGEFFGRNVMFTNIVATIFAVGGGSFLDHAKSSGISGFVWIFVTASIIALVNALLHLPQADVPHRKHESSRNMLLMIRQTFSNKPLIPVIAYATVWSMQSISAPFFATYLLRDLNVSYVGLGLASACSTVMVMLSSPFWGRMVDKYGSRPILIACAAAVIPVPFMWIWVTTAKMVYYLVCPAHIVVGIAVGGITVALNAMVFKVTPVSGRSVQLAIYTIIVTLVAAPMPTIGGYLPDWLHSLGIDIDLRCVFWASQFFIFIATLIACTIHEPLSRSAKELVHDLPANLRSSKTNAA